MHYLYYSILSIQDKKFIVWCTFNLKLTTTLIKLAKIIIKCFSQSHQHKHSFKRRLHRIFTCNGNFSYLAVYPKVNKISKVGYILKCKLCFFEKDISRSVFISIRYIWTITIVRDIMLVPKVFLYYLQIWGYHPCMGSLLPADNKYI